MMLKILSNFCDLFYMILLYDICDAVFKIQQKGIPQSLLKTVKKTKKKEGVRACVRLCTRARACVRGCACERV